MQSLLKAFCGWCRRYFFPPKKPSQKAVHENHFDFLRIFAAALVIWSHSHDLLNIEDPPLIYGMSSSMIGLTIFFAISGFLVSGSALSQTHFSDFFRRRFFRIWPALAVNIILCALLIGPIYSTLPIRDYFSQANTWIFLAGIFIYTLRWQLPGVWQELPAPGINGSLWTIPHEFSFYLLTWALKKIGALGNWVLLACLALGCAVVIDVFKTPIEEAKIRILFVSTRWLLHFGAIFLAGALFRVLWKHQRVLLGLTSLTLGLIFALPEPGIWRFYTFFAFTGVILFSAHLPYGRIFGTITRGIDFSYGLYLWGFPIQQALIYHFGPKDLGPLKLSLITLCIALTFAFFSWTFIERPALDRVRGG